MKSGNLNFLEPCGPLQACNGTALRFYLTGGRCNELGVFIPPSHLYVYKTLHRVGIYLRVGLLVSALHVSLTCMRRVHL